MNTVEKIGTLTGAPYTNMLYCPDLVNPVEKFKLIKLGDWNGPIRKKLSDLAGKTVKVTGEIEDMTFLSVDSIVEVVP